LAQTGRQAQDIFGEERGSWGEGKSQEWSGGTVASHKWNVASREASDTHTTSYPHPYKRIRFVVIADDYEYECDRRRMLMEVDWKIEASGQRW